MIHCDRTCMIAKTMKKIKTIIVVPTIREASIKRFLEEWDKELFGDKRFFVHLFIVEDNPTKTFRISLKKRRITHYSWDNDTKIKDSSFLYDI